MCVCLGGGGKGHYGKAVCCNPSRSLVQHRMTTQVKFLQMMVLSVARSRSMDAAGKSSLILLPVANPCDAIRIYARAQGRYRSGHADPTSTGKPGGGRGSNGQDLPTRAALMMA